MHVFNYRLRLLINILTKCVLFFISMMCNYNPVGADFFKKHRLFLLMVLEEPDYLT